MLVEYQIIFTTIGLSFPISPDIPFQDIIYTLGRREKTQLITSSSCSCKSCLLAEETKWKENQTCHPQFPKTWYKYRTWLFIWLMCKLILCLILSGIEDQRWRNRSLKAYIGFYVHIVKQVNTWPFSCYMLGIHYFTGNSYVWEAEVEILLII